MTRPSKLPVVPLLRGAVLLPGVTLRIPLQNRSDIPILLTSLFSRANPRLANPDVILGCVPECSPLLGPDGQQLLDSRPASASEQTALQLDLERGRQREREREREQQDGDDQSLAGTAPPAVPKEDLFRYGTLARVIGVQGRPNSEPYLLVEGTKRFVVQRIVRETPYCEAEVTIHHDPPIAASDPNIPHLFDELKMLSRELLTLLRLTSLLTSANGPIPVSLVRRFEIFIAKKSVSQAGQLADFMADVVEASYEEKLQVLAALDLQDRLERVIELLSRQVTGFKNNIKLTTSVTTTGFPPGMPLDINPLNTPDHSRQPHPPQPHHKRPPPLARRPPSPAFGDGARGLPPYPPGFPFGGPRDLDEDKDPNELDELQHKLHDAQLSTEVQKVADREMRRLKKMNPANAEYGVTRTYLETIAEIPWMRVTEDQIGPATLTRARKQLDDDHYGLQGIKKRLLEYLAVLKLKHAVNEDVDAQIRQLSEELKSGEHHVDDDTEHAHDHYSTRRLQDAATVAGVSAGRGDEHAHNTDEHDYIQHHSDDNDLHNHHSDRGATEAKLQALRTRRMTDKSPILLLVGPPGTGKTSLARSIATSLGRKFHRISLGGVRDEAEIRGHRRTYVAAMPGLVVNGLKKVGVANPVFLLDEIDKVGGPNFHGDPSAAMLEVLDPEQNHAFSDHYVGIPIDLSKVLFIATANSLETIPPPLLDRMETVHFSGYTAVEKRHIARNHLLPKQVLSNGLADGLVRLPDVVLDKIINSYTREAGVRNLERQLGAVARHKAVQFADAKDSGSLDGYEPTVTLAELETILGVEPFEEEIAEKSSRPGIVTGLVAFSSGGTGGILFIEVAAMPGTGRVQLTGKLGDVLKESVEVALTWVKAHAFELGLARDRAEDIMQRRSLHVHCPGGAIPKDGPSAGLAHTVALVSLFSNKPVPPHVAMTGEVSLRGRVLPVGGVKEKLIGAHRAGVKLVLLPEGNRKDVADVPEEVKKEVEIVHVQHIWDAIKQIWPHGHWPQDHRALYESRL